jgi:hypothetical protein
MPVHGNMTLHLPERATENFINRFRRHPTRTTAATLYPVAVQGPGDAYYEKSFEKEENPPETENVRRETSKDDLQKEKRDIGDVSIGHFCRHHSLVLRLIYARINQEIDHRGASYVNNCAIIPARKQRKNPNTPKLNSIFTVP